MTVVDQRAREGRDRQQLILHEAKALADLAVGEDDRGRRRERAAGGNADQRGIGEGVSKQPLHDGAGCREQGADHRGRRDPRNPDRPQHELVARERWTGCSVRPQAERRRQPRQRNSGSAHRERDQRRAGKRDEQADEGQRSGGRNAYPLRRFARSALSASAVIAGNLPSAPPA